MKKLLAIIFFVFLIGCSVKNNIELTRDNTIDIRNRLTVLEKNFLKFDSIITEMSIYQREKGALELQITQSIDMKIEALREALQLSKSEINSLVMRFESLSDTTGVSSSEAFSLSYSDYTNGDYEMAELGFSSFLERYSQSIKVLDALFYLAESKFYQENYSGALTYFSRLRVNYPLNKFQSTVLYHSGICEEKLGDTINAKKFFNEVINAYPASPEAELAKDKLLKY